MKDLERQALERIGKDWSKASLTRVKLLANTKEFARYVTNKYGLRKIDNLKPGHILSYAEDLHMRGLAASTIANKMTAVREVAASIGKKNIVARRNVDYGIVRVRINPQSVDQAKLLEIRVVLQNRADQGDPIAKMMLAADSLRMSFGLRAKESLLSKDTIEKNGAMYLVIVGSKGGRPRELLVDDDAKLKSIQLVRKTSEELGSGTCRIIPPNLSLRQAYDKQRNEWRALGGTRVNGGNMHGERHLHAREMLLKGATNDEIMTELGHGQGRSPAAYVGK